jgi:hypothetical protein
MSQAFNIFSSIDQHDELIEGFGVIMDPLHLAWPCWGDTRPVFGRMLLLLTYLNR